MEALKTATELNSVYLNEKRNNLTLETVQKAEVVNNFTEIYKKNIIHYVKTMHTSS